MISLQHSELVAHRLVYTGIERLLFSVSIPVHPYVLTMHNSYSEEFLAGVRSQVSEYIVRDLDAIREVLGIGLSIAAGKRMMRHLEGVFDYDRVMREVFEGRIRLAYLDYSFELDLNGPAIPLELVSVKSHPMGTRLEEYAYNGKVHFWQATNPESAPLHVQLYFRNFAIAWNNIGLEHFGV